LKIDELDVKMKKKMKLKNDEDMKKI